MVLDPARKRRIAFRGKRQHEAPKQRAVVRQIVAAEDRETLRGGPAARVERRNDQSHRAQWSRGIGKIVHDIRMREVEPAARRVVTVALLGHGQGDDVGRRCVQSRGNAVAVRAEEQDFAHAADDAPAQTFRALLDAGVQPILRRKSVAHVRRAQAHPTDAPGPLHPRQGIIGVDGRLRAMKRADAEMDDADGDQPRIVRRRGDRRRQVAQRGERQPCHVAG